MGQYDFSGQSAVVTGSSRGIGAAIAVELAQCGARLTLTGRDEAALAEVAAAVEKASGAKPTIVACDLREAPAAAQVVAAAVKANGGIDVLVNNAGATKRGDFLTLADEDFLDGFALKFHGAVRMTRAAWPHLVQSKGKLVNIVGIGSLTPAKDFTIGGPVNSALINFTKAMADRGLKDGVRVNAVNPGHIVTDRLRRRVEVLAKAKGISYAAAEEMSRNEHGILRFGTPEEIADLVAFLCSDRATYIHGSTIEIDGGATKGL
ncbi:MAG: SDR family oxidoreductase [Hyphomicrobiaceae bacterium]